MSTRKIALLPLISCFCLNVAFAQSVSYSALFDNSTFSRSIDLSKPVGSIDGAAGTTPSGGATYTIPIKCPPGTNGVSPQIAIVYNSQGGNGVLGQGWSLSGLSAITRAGKDHYHDGKVSPVSYTNDDAFMLDGQRLVPTSGNNGDPGTSYRTEAESYSVVTSNESIGGGPRYFNVVAKDGSIMQYGYTDDSRFVSDDDSRIMMWRLNKIKDVNGNYISFHYDNSGRGSKINQVKYTGNENVGLEPYLEINFEYGVRKDKSKIYDGGYSIKSDYLLTKIVIKDATDIFKVYQFNYALHGIAEKSYLNSVLELAGDGTELNDTRFKLNLGSDNGYSYYVPTITESNIEMPNHPPYPGSGYYYSYNEALNAADFNGDGVNEIYVSYRRTKNSNYAATDNATSDINIKAYKSGGLGSSIYAETNVTSYTEVHKKGTALVQATNKVLIPYDYNGDGKADIFGYKLNEKKLEKRTIYYSTSGSTLSFTATDLSTLPAPDNLIANHFNLHGDFDGDGSMDFLTVVKNNDTKDAQYLAKLTFPKLGKYDQNLLEPGSIIYDRGAAKGINNATITLIIDYNGDGKSDILTYNVISQILIISEIKKEAVSYSLNLLHWESVNVDNIYPGDFNGDGKTDLLLLKNVSGYRDLKVAYSKGAQGFEKADVDFGRLIQCPDAAFNILIGDFDASGTSDFIAVNELCKAGPGVDRIPKGESEYTTFFSDDFGKFYGSGLYTTSSELDIDVIDDAVTPLVADVTGDGVEDFVYKPIDNNKLKILSYPARADMRFLKEVTDGFNRTTEFIYDPLSKGGDIYTKGSGETYPVNNAQYPIYVVTSMKMPDGIGGISNTAFRYENLRLHRAGRGLLGFEKVRSINFATGTEAQSQYELNREFYVSYLKTSKTFLSRDPSVYSLATTNYSFTRIGSGYCFKQADSSGSAEDLLAGRSSTYSNTYDGDGNIAYATRTANGDVSITTTTETNYTKVAGSPFFNAPADIAVTTQRGSKPSVMDKTVLEYDSKGRLKHSYTNPNGILDPAKTVHKYWTYDSYGNKASDKDFVLGMSYVPYTSYEYDAQGRFVTKKINNLGDYTEYTTHKFWGQPLSVTGITGLVSSNTYDAWGKLTSSSVPVSSSVSYTIKYSDGWDLGTNQLYYTLTRDPSAPDVKTWYDNMGRGVKTQQEHSSGSWTNAWTRYDVRGNVAEQSNSYLPAETPLTTAYEYDDRNRLSSETTPTGTTKYAYNFSGGSAFTTVTLPDGKIKKSKTDASGKLVESDNGIAGTVIFDYDSRGNELSARMKVFSSGMTFVNKGYDQWGRLIRMDDADAGITTYKYDAFSRLKEQKDPKGKTTYFRYESDFGRLAEKELDGIKTTYTYYGKGKGYQLQQEEVKGGSGTVLDGYDYTEAGNLALHVKNTNSVVTAKTFTYDGYGRPLVTEYSSGLGTRNQYDGYGFLQKITTNFAGGGPGERVLYEAGSRRGDGQIQRFTRNNGLTTEYTYEYGTVTRMQDMSGIYDLGMGYDFNNGNLWARGDLYAQTQEFFTYDGADRLTSSQAGKTDGSATWPAVSLQYDVPSPYWTGSYGRIVSKSDAGVYGYHSVPRNAVASITDPNNLVSHETQEIVYTPFHKAAQIRDTIGSIPYEENFVYDAGEDRAYSEQVQGGALMHQRWYMGDYEVDRFAGSAEQQLHYISGEGGLCAIVVKEGSVFTYYSAYTDHLGSIVLLTDDAGIPIYRQSYDPWGRERDPETWDHGSGWGAKPRWLTRGYTGHEMLPEYGLINMNGRMYDPLNGRMLRPDKYVQDHTNSQSYNRYSYCWNNPMKYTDPSGEIIWAPIIIGAMIGGFANYTMQGLSGNINNPWDGFKAFGIGALAGAAAGGVGAGVNAAIAGGSFGSGFIGTSAVSSTGFIAGAATGVSAGAISGFILGTGNGLLGGQNFKSALGNGLDQAWKQGLAGGITGGITGGINASTNGRNFWTGNYKQYAMQRQLTASIDNNFLLDEYNIPKDATVANGDSYRVYYRSENGEAGLRKFVKPGYYIKNGIDGISTSKYSDMVYKVPDGGRVMVTPGGNVKLSMSSYNRLKLNALQTFSSYQYGWLKSSFFERIGAYDIGWRILYKAAPLITTFPKGY
jgi:RHS repeat-associated protein